MKTGYDKELINSLCNSKNNNHIYVIDDPENIIAGIEQQYSFGYSGIDWGTVKYDYFFDLKKSNLSVDQDMEKCLQEVVNMVPEIINAEAIFFGDALNLAYSMQFSDFIELHQLFLSIPQHSYLWFPKLKKCINFTLESEFFFG
ncbi:hypothetical protein D3C72_1267390 [compost metagenome]